MAAFRKLAFVFLLVSGTQWLSAAIRTPIFQDYVSVQDERLAREYAIWVIIPMMLVYNVLTGIFRPQNLIWWACMIYGGLLTMCGMYAATLDYNGGATAVAHCDARPDEFSWLWTKKFRHFVMYFMFIVIETRSVILNGMVVSFLQLYMGNNSRDVSISVFAFTNFWQQIGVILFLLSGTASRILQLDLGGVGPISGAVILLIVVSMVTVAVAIFAVPAFDTLEEMKQIEEAEDENLPEHARVSALRSSGLNDRSNSRGTTSNTGRGNGGNPGDEDSPSGPRRRKGAKTPRKDGAATTYGTSVCATNGNPGNQGGTSGSPCELSNDLESGELMSKCEISKTPPRSHSLTGEATDESRETDALIAKKMGGAPTTAEERQPLIATKPPKEKFSRKMMEVLYSSVEGLKIMFSHHYIALIMFVTYANLPIRQMIDIQLAILLGDIYPCPPDLGDSIAPPTCSAVKDAKLVLMTTCGLVSGALNALVNVCGTKQLVKNLGVRVTLLLNPFFGLACLSVFGLSYMFSQRHGYIALNYSMRDVHAPHSPIEDIATLSYSVPVIPWNDAASGEIIEVTDPFTQVVTNWSPESKDSLAGKVCYTNWKDHFHSTPRTMAENEPKHDKNDPNHKDEKALSESEWAQTFGLVALDGKSPTKRPVLQGKDTTTELNSLQDCEKACNSNFPECDTYLTKPFPQGKIHCTLFSSKHQASKAEIEHVKLNPEFVLGGNAYTFGPKYSFAEITKRAQENGAAAVFIGVPERKISQVDQGKEHDLTIPTVILKPKDWTDKHKLNNGENLKSIDRQGGNMENAWLGFFGRYILVAIFWMFWAAIHFSINAPSVGLLVLRTTPKVKVKTKSWGNTFGNNLMKMLGNRTNNWINSPVFWLAPTMMAGFSWSIFWFAMAVIVGYTYARLEEQQKYVGEVGEE